MLTLLIEEEPISMLIDSGASCNIINSATARKLQQQGVEFDKCHRTIHPYGSNPIIAKQCVTANIQIAGCNPISAEFLVIHGSQPCILGKATAKELKVLPGVLLRKLGTLVTWIVNLKLSLASFDIYLPKY